MNKNTIYKCRLKKRIGIVQSSFGKEYYFYEINEDTNVDDFPLVYNEVHKLDENLFKFMLAFNSPDVIDLDVDTKEIKGRHLFHTREKEFLVTILEDNVCIVADTQCSFNTAKFTLKEFQKYFEIIK